MELSSSPTAKISDKIVLRDFPYEINLRSSGEGAPNEMRVGKLCVGPAVPTGFAYEIQLARGGSFGHIKSEHVQEKWIYEDLFTCGTSLIWEIHKAGWDSYFPTWGPFDEVKVYDTAELFDSLAKSQPRFYALCTRYGLVWGVLDTRWKVLTIPYVSVMVEGEYVSEDIANFRECIMRLMKFFPQSKGSAKREYNEDRLRIGMDLEFSIIDSELLFHSATEFVPDTQDGEIGTDGNVETLELRPDAEKTPEALTNNLEELLIEMDKMLPRGLDLLGGGGYDVRRSTGLHIHFSGTSSDADKRIRPDAVVSWLDQLIALPILSRCPGVKRADHQYGKLGDWRSKINHGNFPHNGWEWRVLPSVTITKPITKAILTLAYMTVISYEKGYTIKFDEKKFDLSWYKDLWGFDKYKTDVEYFVRICLSNTPFNVPVLKNWFNKEFNKDKECDVSVTCIPSENTGCLNIANFTMYNPQKMFDSIVVYDRGPDKKYITMSKDVPSVTRWLTKTYGYRVKVHDPAWRRQKYGAKSLTIGIPFSILNNFAGRSHGSRNQVKMFIQTLVNNI